MLEENASSVNRFLSYFPFFFFFDHVTDSSGLTVDHEFRPGKTIGCSLDSWSKSPPLSHVRLAVIGCQALPRPTVSRFACKEFSLPLIIRSCILPGVFRTVVSSKGPIKALLWHRKIF